MNDREILLFLCPVVSVSSGVANIGTSKKEGEMTFEQAEADIHISRTNGNNIIHVSIGEFLLSEVKRLREGIEKHRQRVRNTLSKPYDMDEELYKLLEGK